MIKVDFYGIKSRTRDFRGVIRKKTNDSKKTGSSGIRAQLEDADFKHIFIMFNSARKSHSHLWQHEREERLDRCSIHELLFQDKSEEQVAKVLMDIQQNMFFKSEHECMNWLQSKDSYKSNRTIYEGKNLKSEKEQYLDIPEDVEYE